MKKIIMALFMVLSMMSTMSVCYAQTEEDATPKSKTLAFMAKDGSFFKRETINLPSAGPVKCEVLVITDVKTNDKIACLRLITEYYISGGNTDSYIGTLDSDEIDAVIQCIDHLQTEEFPSQTDLYTEVTYKSRDGIQIGAYFSPDAKKKEWQPFVYTQRSTRSRKYPTQEAIAQIKINCESAKQIINERLGK